MAAGPHRGRGSRRPSAPEAGGRNGAGGGGGGGGDPGAAGSERGGGCGGAPRARGPSPGPATPLPCHWPRGTPPAPPAAPIGFLGEGAGRPALRTDAWRALLGHFQAALTVQPRNNPGRRIGVVGAWCKGGRRPFPGEAAKPEAGTRSQWSSSSVEQTSLRPRPWVGRGLLGLRRAPPPAPGTTEDTERPGSPRPAPPPHTGAASARRPQAPPLPLPSIPGLPPPGRRPRPAALHPAPRVSAHGPRAPPLPAALHPRVPAHEPQAPPTGTPTPGLRPGEPQAPPVLAAPTPRPASPPTRRRLRPAPLRPTSSAAAIGRAASALGSHFLAEPWPRSGLALGLRRPRPAAPPARPCRPRPACSALPGGLRRGGRAGSEQDRGVPRPFVPSGHPGGGRPAGAPGVDPRAPAGVAGADPRAPAGERPPGPASPPPARGGSRGPGGAVVPAARPGVRVPPGQRGVPRPSGRGPGRGAPPPPPADSGRVALPPARGSGGSRGPPHPGRGLRSRLCRLGLPTPTVSHLQEDLQPRNHLGFVVPACSGTALSLQGCDH
ncbi:basic proline-rich protein-like [Perognathus longimembris pacificus]|uniref:basic proline-rich protein-like n=1 Tax=Perognathus longimembris pacificus TaxID=214514 RepID=UPI00201A0F8B|nr:basic proline-rich protein-like [Perognathus longimembris pacificus]